ncbi:MAG: hypothetical protein Q8764_02450 [Pigeon pea little leaf phytoplasma]|uniref:Uncharacterized protein n=1 Tax=Candidatus Phytoplasma fabacearum TaxID=2982628 RepID=A0ABU8ZV94_9MOLU|nr:hypothetical protein [Candidatus Phytoplasma australasiaticum]MDV3146672.1 hypothetical protein [Sweet potato little leaf phytoplasma]MDV3158186.1 hypothetical protein [Pigeon pea little leaf phytoplasma]MDO8031773.1 hypothetical protein [Candidatus Phytoplasma australasiaticum]MDO8053815.1 hypothetical protein [Candidatus Phytoplasma australasiaticum]MDV3138172.1 hypothetical protein [Candidatus Phytoplasma australasiaticum]
MNRKIDLLSMNQQQIRELDLSLFKHHISTKLNHQQLWNFYCKFQDDSEVKRVWNKFLNEIEKPLLADSINEFKDYQRCGTRIHQFTKEFPLFYKIYFLKNLIQKTFFYQLPILKK